MEGGGAEVWGMGAEAGAQEVVPAGGVFARLTIRIWSYKVTA